jgi:hypothetical protein
VFLAGWKDEADVSEFTIGQTVIDRMGTPRLGDIESLPPCLNESDQRTYQSRDSIPCSGVQQVPRLAGKAEDLSKGDEGIFENDGSRMLERHV